MSGLVENGLSAEEIKSGLGILSATRSYAIGLFKIVG
jgi:hypothetical protein